MIQILTGKGNFEYHLHKIKKLDSPFCRFCGTEEGDMEHYIERCPSNENLRLLANQQTGIYGMVDVSPSNLCEFLSHFSALIPKLNCERTRLAAACF